MTRMLPDISRLNTNSIRGTSTNRIFVCTGGLFDAHKHRCVSEHNDRARGANC